MKQLLAGILCISCSVVAFAQEEYLATEENLSETPTTKIEVIGDGGSQLSPRAQAALIDAHANAKRGAATYFIGLGLNLVVAVPMSFIAAVDNSRGLAISALGVSLLTTGFEIAGPIRCGIGGSLAHEQAVASDIAIGPPKHWEYYKVGWGFVVVAGILNAIKIFSPDPEIGVSLAAGGLSIMANAMWTASCLNSLNYTQEINEKVGLVQFGIQPYLHSNGAYGLSLSATF